MLRNFLIKLCFSLSIYSLLLICITTNDFCSPFICMFTWEQVLLNSVDLFLNEYRIQTYSAILCM